MGKKSNKGKCYTFIRTFHLGNEKFIKWQRIMLTDKEYPTFQKVVKLTAFLSKSKDCGCK